MTKRRCHFWPEEVKGWNKRKNGVKRKNSNGKDAEKETLIRRGKKGLQSES